MIRFVIADLATKETTGFFPALWALATHNKFAEKEMSAIYVVERAAFARVIAEIRPDLAKAEQDLLALFISASIEGHTMFIGFERKNAAAGPAIANIAVYSFISLVRGIESDAIRGLTARPRARTKRLAS